MKRIILLLTITLISNNLFAQDEAKFDGILALMGSSWHQMIHANIVKDTTYSPFVNDGSDYKKFWYKEYTAKDLENIVNTVKQSISVKIEERGEAAMTIAGVAPEDYYNAILIESKYVSSIDDHFFEIELIPQSIKIDGKSFTLYPEDRHLKLNESGFLSAYKHTFVQRIPIADKSTALSGKVEVVATLQVKLYPSMANKTLNKEFKGGFFGGTRIQILKMEGTNAIVRFKDFNNDIGVLGIGTNDKELNHFISNMPVKVYDYLVRHETFDQERYQSFLDAIGNEIEKPDTVIKIFNGSSSSVDLEKLIFYLPNGTPFNHEELLEINN